eukprot:TRINITY_DN64537_c0_g2_i1.p1 TRINITY_DN64537_c0_g2~~TRINITY_DN64537_c0_g2_i1.p1  ORF type:complete len:689 (+),score=71.67 TRINITY_DN64537_c0_g2_i1:35-2101(+)
MPGGFGGYLSAVPQPWSDLGILMGLPAQAFREAIDADPKAIIPPRVNTLPVNHPFTFLHVAVLRCDLESIEYLVGKHSADPNLLPAVTRRFAKPISALQLAGLIYRDGAALMHSKGGGQFGSKIEELAFVGDVAGVADWLHSNSQHAEGENLEEPGDSPRQDLVREPTAVEQKPPPRSALPDNKTQPEEASASSQTSQEEEENTGFTGNVGLAAHYAAAGGFTEILQLFGKNVNRRIAMCLKLTTLHCAAANNQLGACQWLLANMSEQSHFKDEQGKTAVLWAARNGAIEVTQWMITKGGSTIQEGSRDGDTPLMWAARKGHLALVQWLVNEAGCSVHEINTHGHTPLMTSCSKGHPHVVKWLLENGSDITYASQRGTTALLVAAEKGRLEVLEVLVSHGGAITERNEAGQTAMLLACRYGHTEVAQYLISLGADVNVVDKHNNTCMHYAVSRGFLEIVQALVKAGAQVLCTESDKARFSAAVIASCAGQLAVLQWLLQEGGMDINEVDELGYSVLDHACQQGQLPVVQWLLCHTNVYEQQKCRPQRKPSEGSDSEEDAPVLQREPDYPMLAALQFHMWDVVEWLICTGWAGTSRLDRLRIGAFGPLPNKVSPLQDCWTIKTFVVFPVDFQIALQLGLWLMQHSKLRNTDCRLPPELVFLAANFWPSNAFPVDTALLAAREGIAAQIY